MNIMRKLTLRHLKENKKRTLVTIIGTIVSVAMITAVATLAVSFIDLLKRDIIADQGEWHVRYFDVDKEQVEAIGNDKQTKELLLSDDLGYAYFEESTNENKPYFFIKEYNEAALENYPIKIEEGRLPQSETEIVISKEMNRVTDNTFQIGDTITLEIGEREATVPIEGMDDELNQNYPIQLDQDGQLIEKLNITTERSFTIVGIMDRPTWEPTWAPGYSMVTYLDKDSLGDGDKVIASVSLQKIDRNLYDHANKLAEQLNIEKIDFNNDLLRLYGVSNNDNIRRTMYSLASIIMAIIIIGSVSLIYNAFAISVSERSRHLGMLSSVGATKKQKRNSVFFEGAVIGAISIPLGIISGIAGIGATFLFINEVIPRALGSSQALELVVTPWSILVACVISIVTIFISTYVPARRASKISAIDAIRQSQDIKLSRKKVKTSKLVRKLFGIEAEIGLKNLKRNKKRYRVTVFSLVISIFLFLTVSYFTENMHKGLDLTQEEINFDMEMYPIDARDNFPDTLISQIKDLDEVTDFSHAHYFIGPLTTWFDEDKISEKAKEQSHVEGGKYRQYISLISLDDENITSYAEQVGVDVQKLYDTKNMKAILINQMQYYDQAINKFVEEKSYNGKVGDLLSINGFNYETEEEFYINHIEIGALTDKYPMGVSTSGALQVIVSKPVYEELTKSLDIHDKRQSIYLKSSDPMKTQKDIEEIKESNIRLFNVYEMREQTEQMVLVMSIFTYGFISLITIISIANIFNTISTSIALRRREFAMLKSVGMTPKSFNKMINYESIFYGIKALLYGLPLSIGFMYLIYMASTNSFDYGFFLPWTSIIIAIIAVFIIVTASMLYSTAKVKKENIIDTLKQENI